MRVNRHLRLFTLTVFGQSAFLLCGATPPALQGEKAIQALKAEGQYDTLRAAYSAVRHRVENQGRGYRIENPENGFAAEFGARGINGSHAGGTFGLRFTGYGYGDQLVKPQSASITANGATVQYHRGAVTEWYRNEAAGLEQGFTLAGPPAAPASGPLTLEVAVTGDLNPTMAGRDVRLERGGRTVLAYTGLRAWDAAGKELPARMQVVGDRIRLQVTESGAQYPVTVDPLLQQQLNAPDAATGDFYGFAVALSGNTAVIGAPTKTISGKTNQGAVYVFVRNVNSWSLQQELLSNDGTMNDQFGRSVSISGNTLAIGAWGKDVTPNTVQGVAYVFTRSGTVWTQASELFASDPATNDDFGWSVSVNGSTVAVGAPNKAQQLGAVYVYVSSGGPWTQQQKITSSDTAIGDRFGWSVSLDTDTIVAGAPFKGAGEAYAFVRSGTTWTEQQKIASPVGGVPEYFGYSAAVSGNTALIGALGDQSNTGAAFVFVRSGTAWNQTQKLTAPDAAIGDQFGLAVALNGTFAAIGAPAKKVGANNSQGTAYLFSFNGSTWAMQQELTAADGAVADTFGTAVAVDSGTPLVGAPGKSGGANTGGAYVYITPTNAPVPSDFDLNRVPDLVWQNESTRQVVVDYYGGTGGATVIGWNYLYPGLGATGWHVVATADFNGDGSPDLVWQNDATRQVTVHYYGGSGGATDLGWNWLYAKTDAAGWHVVAAADFNGDGVPDLVWQNDSTRQVVVDYYGGAGGATFIGWNFLYPGTGAAGWHVAAAADFNSDGVPDLVWQNDSTRQVTVHYYGGVGGATDLGWNWLYASTGAAGWHIAKAADFDGNGVADLVWQNDTTGQATVHYYGGAGGASDIGWNWLYQSNVPGWTVR